MSVQIRNRESLATSPIREQVLQLVEAAYVSIDTEERIHSTVRLEGDILTVGGYTYDISRYRSVSVIGFGKASSKAAQALEAILGEKLTGGIVLDKDPLMCKRITVYQGSHPQPSAQNVDVSEKIASFAKGLTEEDLALVVVSGGGSSLLCWPQSECDQGARLYNDFLGAGGSINELNILRKHLSGMKGGGLAKLLYPAHTVGLILCDVPGEHYDTVASGPTYYDTTTADDAQKLLETYGITESFAFIETPKDKTLFTSVVNVPVVSNRVALEAMTALASSWGYNVISLGDERYDDPASIIDGFLKVATPKSVVIGGGEPRMIVTSGGGIGGRNEYLSAKMIESIPEGSVFVSFASDGIDNCSEAAGGIVDSALREKAATLSQSITMYLDTYKHDELLAALGARILVGPTEANVSDLFFLITP